MAETPGYVVLHLYHHENKKHEQYDALVLNSRQFEGEEYPRLTVAYFDHLDTASHHALHGIDWADTLERVIEVPHEDEAEGQPFYYEDVLADFAHFAERTHKAIADQSKRYREALDEIKLLKAELANTTEGRDKALQELADAGARKKPKSAHASEGLPSAADLDGVAEEEKTAEATNPTE
jgi:hypothetical protein